MGIKKLYILLISLIAFSSCDLDLDPVDENLQTPNNVFVNDEAYKAALAKLYASFIVTGQEGPSGNGDIGGLDEGSQASFSRMLWTHQELPTEEAVCVWNDQTIKDFHYNKWTPADPFTWGMYDRLVYNVTICNEFVRNATDAKFSTFVAEARFLRALSYYYLLDLYGGNVTFVTEKDAIGSFFPKQTNGADLYKYIETELLTIVGEKEDKSQVLLDAKAGKLPENYGRADKAAAWMVLAKLYLNSEVYINTAKYTEALTYCKKIIGAGYEIEDNYQKLFSADNKNNKEIIYSLIFDGNRTRAYGGVRFLISASVGGKESPSERNIVDGWGGLITTPTFVDKFISGDKRAMFFTTDQDKALATVDDFKNGYGITKFTNKSTDGNHPKDTEWPETDFPLFRLADVYLMYAEAVKRGGTGGDEATALTYINKISKRAFGNETQKKTSYDLDFLLEERSRELYWEAHRRQDLRRFGKFSSASYLWTWKGNTYGGKGFEPHREIFPIPQNDRNANPNLKQNPNY